MPTKKPLSTTDDAILDLTDLGGKGGGKAASGANPMDAGFDNELDDLFGDTEPMPPKTPPAAPLFDANASDVDDDMIDLAGLEVDDADAADATGDDVMDLTGFDLEDAGNGDDDIIDLGDFDAEDSGEATPPKAATDDDSLDFPDLDLGDLDDKPSHAAQPGDDVDPFGDLDLDASDGTASAAKDVLDLDSLSLDVDDDAPTGKPAHDDTMDLGTLDFEDDAETPAAASDDDAMDLGALGFDADEDLPAGKPAAAKSGMDDLDMDLGSLLDDELEGTPETPPAKPKAATPTPKPAPMDDEALNFDDPFLTPEGKTPLAMPAAAVAGAAAVGAMAMAAKGKDKTPPAPQAQPGAIDVNALDQLIDAPTASQSRPAAEKELPVGTLTALADRVDALEATAASLAGKLDAMPLPPDEEALASAVVIQLEDLLTQRFEALLANHVTQPELGTLKNEVFAAIEAGRPDNEALLADLQQGLAPQFEALRQELPKSRPDEVNQQAEMAAALKSLRASIARLETLTQERQTQFDDFASTMETRLAELRRELPEAEAFVSPTRLDEALSALRESLGTDIAAAIETRLAAVSEAARQAAREEAQTLGAALSDRLDALEADHISSESISESIIEQVRETLALPDAEALKDTAATAERAETAAKDALTRLESKIERHDLEAAIDAVLDAALTAIRTEMKAEIEQAVPRAAAAVIREEIAALMEEFN